MMQVVLAQPLTVLPSSAEVYKRQVQPCGIAQDHGADDVAVQLLEHQNEDDEVQALHGIDDQQQQRRGDRADVGTEEGDDVGDAHNDGDQHGIAVS